MNMTIIPVHPEPPEDNMYSLWACTWITQNGTETTLLVSAITPEDAAEVILHVADPRITLYTERASIDVRKCYPVITYRPRMSV